MNQTLIIKNNVFAGKEKKHTMKGLNDIYKKVGGILRKTCFYLSNIASAYNAICLTPFIATLK